MGASGSKPFRKYRWYLQCKLVSLALGLHREGQSGPGVMGASKEVLGPCLNLKSAVENRAA